ncbi:MAG: ATP-binding protein [Cyanobacteria bacterium CRU_2_1]|nr:ATP-binding protein [Cyanobacteria bacterium RU_5_0]NJR58153.1 ATP-binding protein [Cyanobacteria bacterium CRU_2_1]
MVSNPFVPRHLIGRQVELAQVSQIFAADGDLMVAGVPGSGRRSLVRWAAHQVGARVLEIDCLRATNASRFLELLAEGLLEVFSEPNELGLIQQWSTQHPLILEQTSTRRARLVWHVPTREEWIVLQALLTLPQMMAEWLDCRVVFVFQNFPHIRSWDRSGKWEEYLRQEIQRQSRVNYAVIATVVESWASESHLQVMTLPPLEREAIESWVIEAMAFQGLKFDVDAIELFLKYVQGHLGDAIALARRTWLECRITDPQIAIVQPHHVHRSLLSLVADLSLTFESLILLLPPIQARVLESLAIDPTDSPHSRDYLQKHQLSRGGGLQGALTGLEQKGLIYGSKFGYRMAMPLLVFWLRHRIV